MEDMDLKKADNNSLEETFEDTEAPLDLTEQESEPIESEEIGVDYEALAREDLSTLKEQFPELSSVSDISELENPLRYAALRDLGLTPEEAYLATSRRRPQRDNRSHLVGAVPKAAKSPRGVMSDRELSGAREIFSDLSDAEIRNLYKKVTQ